MADSHKLHLQNTNEEKESSETHNIVQLECAVCLQNCVHPVKLNCHHIFCFLCVKGVTTQGKRCPMCRREISPGYLDKPNLVTSTAQNTLYTEKVNISNDDSFSWFYEGRNGWWEYEERAATELEVAYKKAIDTGNEQNSNLKFDCGKSELLIAGILYVIDFEQMVQFRKHAPQKQRKIKRDKLQNVSDYKGVAGLRISVHSVSHSTNISKSQPLAMRNTDITSTSYTSTAELTQLSQSSVDSTLLPLNANSEPDILEVQNVIDSITTSFTNIDIQADHNNSNNVNEHSDQ